MIKTIIIALLTIVSFSPLIANPWQPCYAYSCSEYQFYVSVDWLYWRLRRGDLDFALSQKSGINLQNIDRVAMQYYSGIRANTQIYVSDDLGIGVSYFYYSPKENDEQEVPVGGLLQPTRFFTTLFPISLATANYSLNFQQLDIFVTYKHFCNCYSDLHLCFGGRALYCKEHLHTEYFNELESVVLGQKNEINGYGLVIGGEYFLKLCYFFNLYMQGAFGVLDGDMDASTIDPFQRKKKDQLSTIFSTLDLAIGIAYRGPRVFCMKPSFILGYELHNYFPFQGFLTVFETDPTPSRNNTSFGFDGLFFRVVAEF